MNQNTNITGETYRETPTVESLLLQFVETEFKRNVHLKESGANDYSEKCLRATGAMIANHSKESFGVETFYHYCQPFEPMPFEFKRDFFRRFVDMLIKNNRAIETFGCYENSIFELK